MISQEPKNEQPICRSVMGLIAKLQQENIIKVAAVDSVVRDRPAVEFVFKTETGRFAIEHTRIESFPAQIAEGKQFAELLDPLEAGLRGRLPGAFYLYVNGKTAGIPRLEHDAVRRALSEWILTNAVNLDPEDQTGPDGNCRITETPAGVPFSVTLCRESTCEDSLLIVRSSPKERSALLRERIGTSLGRKCPKLQQMRDNGYTSILVLESDDIALANRSAIASATGAELEPRCDQPDVILWVRTSTQPWKAWFLKNGAEVHPNIAAPGPFVLDPLFRLP